MSDDTAAIARLIATKMGKPERLICRIGDRPGQVLRHAASTHKVARVLGWPPKVAASGGLDKTIAWYQSHRPWWER